MQLFAIQHWAIDLLSFTASVLATVQGVPNDAQAVLDKAVTVSRWHFWCIGKRPISIFNVRCYKRKESFEVYIAATNVKRLRSCT